MGNEKIFMVRNAGWVAASKLGGEIIVMENLDFSERSKMQGGWQPPGWVVRLLSR